MKISEEDLEIAIWHISEPLDYFESKLHLHFHELEIVRQLSARKQLEWYSSRYLLHIMSGRIARGRFDKDEHGKPHLIDSEYHISISHSRNRVAVMASPYNIGIDLQYYVEKITRIQRKFVREDEEKFIQKEQTIKGLHIIWGAKESLYKAYGKRGLDFRKHLKIDHLITNEKEGLFSGEILKDGLSEKYRMNYKSFSEYILVYAKESI